MNLRIDVYVHGVMPDATLQNMITVLTQKVDKAMATLDDIVQKVQALTTVDDSVVTLLGDLKAKLDAAIAGGADPAKLQALSDALGQQTQRLSDAVTQNTPAA
jgi:hypothetical protein